MERRSFNWTGNGGYCAVAEAGRWARLLLAARTWRTFGGSGGTLARAARRLLAS